MTNSTIRRFLRSKETWSFIYSTSSPVYSTSAKVSVPPWWPRLLCSHSSTTHKLPFTYGILYTLTAPLSINFSTLEKSRPTGLFTRSVGWLRASSLERKGLRVLRLSRPAKKLQFNSSSELSAGTTPSRNVVETWIPAALKGTYLYRCLWTAWPLFIPYLFLYCGVKVISTGLNISLVRCLLWSFNSSFATQFNKGNTHLMPVFAIPAGGVRVIIRWDMRIWSDLRKENPPSRYYCLNSKHGFSTASLVSIEEYYNLTHDVQTHCDNAGAAIRDDENVEY